MNTQKQGFLVIFLMLIFLLLSPPDSRAEVDVHINIGIPPLVVLSAPPTMLFLAEAGVYVAIGIGHDIFFANGHYYYAHNGNWFRGAGYGGPWTHIRHKLLPQGLKKHKLHKLRMFKNQGHKAFKKHPLKFKGKHFIGHIKSGPKIKAKIKDHRLKKSGSMKNKARHKR